MLSSAFSIAASALFPLPTIAQSQTQPFQLSIEASLNSSALASTPASSPLSPPLEQFPDAPSVIRAAAPAEFAAIFAFPCIAHSSSSRSPNADSADDTREPCVEVPDPYTRFLNTTTPVPFTPEQKAHLALHNLKDPGNIATIVYTAAFTIATNSHTAYGPGGMGFAKNVGYSFLQDATGEFFGTFVVPSLFHEDPHYHRMPHASVSRRVVHAISRTVIAQSDLGALMPNFATLFTYPIAAEISNLYVPGINGNGPSTIERIMTGYASDPVDNLITEFIPDVAKRIHVRVIFVQRLLNPVSSDEYSLP